MRNLLFLISLLTACCLLPTSSFADTANDLRNKISSHNEEIEKLNKEIDQYTKEIDKTATEANTLSNAIKVLDTSRAKVTTEIKKTELNISSANSSIEELGGEITTIEEKITVNQAAIMASLREINQVDDSSMVEVFLGSGSISDFIDEYESLERFQDSIKNKTAELAVYKSELGSKKQSVEGKKKELVSLKGNLNDQKEILDINKKEKNTLLTETKNKETEYKKILTEKQRQKEQFEKELFDFESQLKIIVDPNSYASAKKGSLSWPLDSVFITQNFGKTESAKRLYVSGTHNGVDFRATRGTPVKSVLAGVVKAVGNTDEQRGCYSYGKWVLVEHPNGLASLYAHLDLIKVSSGQSINTGELVGYSGQTGYATGPHLHLTIYASEGVRIDKYASSINCKNTVVPLAPASAYLDPMQYLPDL